jgi:hypothetical protein
MARIDRMDRNQLNLRTNFLVTSDIRSQSKFNRVIQFVTFRK